MTQNVNEKIRALKVLLIDENGNNLGQISTKEAFNKAQMIGLDLVQVGGKEDAPVCRIMDFGKWKYEQSKRKKKNNSSIEVVKEVQLRPNISDNDLQYRAKHVDEFLSKGFKVKILVRFKGREQEHMFETGGFILEKFLSMVQSDLTVNSKPKLFDKSILMIISASKK